MSKYHARLIYFKSTGKYYDEAKLEILSEEIVKNGHCDKSDLASMWLIADRVKNLSTEKALPGVTGDWLSEGYIFIDVPEIGYPVLLKNTP
jgi:hypothetical protein